MSGRDKNGECDWPSAACSHDVVSLSSSLRSFLHRDTIEKCSIFKDAEEPFLRAVTTKLKFCVSLPGDYVFKEDDAGDKIYFLRKGRIEIESVELGTLAILEEGAFFGDIALLLPLPGGGGGGGGGQDAMTGSPPMLPGHGTSGGSGGSISGLSSSSSSSSLLTSSSGGLAVLGTEPAHLRRKRTASAKSVVSSDMYYLMREEFIAILLAYPSYAALFTEISRSRLKQTKLHSDEVLVEKILESWAKKGWLKLRGLKRQPEKAPGGGPIGGGAGGGGGPGMMRPRRAITPSSVLQVMASQRNRAAGASTPVGGSAMPGRKDFGGGIEMTSIGSGANQEGALSSTLTSSSGKPPVRLGMKGMMVLAAVAEHKRSLVAGTIPPKPAPEPAPASSSSAAALPAPAPAPVNLTVDVPTWSRQGAIEVDIRPDTPVQEHQSAGETIAKVAMDG